jgi:hypothetical protein
MKLSDIEVGDYINDRFVGINVIVTNIKETHDNDFNRVTLKAFTLLQNKPYTINAPDIDISMLGLSEIELSRVDSNVSL